MIGVFPVYRLPSPTLRMFSHVPLPINGALSSILALWEISYRLGIDAVIILPTTRKATVFTFFDLIFD